MPRLPPTRLTRTIRPTPIRRGFQSSSLRLAEEPQSTGKSQSGSVHSTPGYEGRGSNDHAVNRTAQLDPQAKAAQSGMEKHAKGEGGSQGLSRKDEGDNNKRAKEEHPEAPGPVLGMNDERGGVSDPKKSDVEVADQAQGYAS